MIPLLLLALCLQTHDTGLGTLTSPFVLWDGNQAQSMKNCPASDYVIEQNISMTKLWPNFYALNPAFTGSVDCKGHTVTLYRMSDLLIKPNGTLVHCVLRASGKDPTPGVAAYDYGEETFP